jgi:hypothetical protein
MRINRRTCSLLKAFFLVSVLPCLSPLYAQKRVVTQQQVWMGYNSQLQLSNKWSITADAHLRTKEHFFTNFSTSVLRAGLIYHVSENINLAAGYAYFHYYPADDHPGIAQPEHRPWQQVQWTNKYPKLRLQQRIRLEERFRRKIKDADELAEGYNFNYRLRFQGMVSFPLSKKAFSANTFALYTGDEVLLNFGKQIIYNTLDHNRLHLGFTYHLKKGNSLQAGYMNIFQQQSSGNRYRAVHVARIYFHHTIDLRRQKSTI